MPTVYTKVAKASGTTYTPVNPLGKEQYDQASLEYDDSTINYDGTPVTYTKVSKASGTVYTKIAKAT